MKIKECPECGRVFKGSGTRGAFVSHLRMHQGTNPCKGIKRPKQIPKYIKIRYDKTK